MSDSDNKFHLFEEGTLGRKIMDTLCRWIDKIKGIE